MSDDERRLRLFRDTPWGAQAHRLVFTLAPVASGRKGRNVASIRHVEVTALQDPDHPGELLVHVRGRCRVTTSEPPAAAELARLRFSRSGVFRGFGPGAPTRKTGKSRPGPRGGSDA